MHALVINFGQQDKNAVLGIALLWWQGIPCNSPRAAAKTLCYCCCCTYCSPAGVHCLTHLPVMGCLHRTAVGTPGLGCNKVIQLTLHAIPSRTYPFSSDQGSLTGLGSTRGQAGAVGCCYYCVQHIMLAIDNAPHACCLKAEAHLCSFQIHLQNMPLLHATAVMMGSCQHVLSLFSDKHKQAAGGKEPQGCNFEARASVQ